MAAGLALTRATVTTPDTSHTEVQVTVRANVARLRTRRGDPVAEQPGVTAVTQAGRRLWQVEFADGTTWQVEQQRGCGCGR